MKYDFIKQLSDEYPVVKLCEVLDVSRSGYYQWIARKPSQQQEANKELLTKIETVYKQHKGRYGSPRIYHQLKTEGVQTSLGRVERLCTVTI